MPKANWRRALLAGIVAGFVWATLYALFHPLVEQHDLSGKPVLPLTFFPAQSAAMRAAVFVNPLVLGLAIAWLYVAIRPRLGPGPRTAATAGLAVWMFGCWVHVTWALFTGLPLRSLVPPLATALPITLVAAMSGAWLYKETPSYPPLPGAGA